MDWLKDKKNMPFVVGGAIVLIIASIFFVLYTNGTFQHTNATPPPVTEVASASSPYPGYPGASPGMRGMTGRNHGMYAGGAGGQRRHHAGMPGGMGASYPGARQAMPPGAPGAPGMASAPGAGGIMGAAASAVPTTAALAAVKPVNPATAKDPFAVAQQPLAKSLRSAGAAIAKSLPSLLTVLPPDNIYTGVKAESQLPAEDRPGMTPIGTQPGNSTYDVASMPRVSGILYNGTAGVFAIIQPSDGPPSTVKPGDVIDGVGKVVSIQATGITVKTDGGQTVDVPISAGPPQQTGYPYGGGYPGGPPMGYPGGPQPGGPMGGYPGGPYGGGYPGGNYNNGPE